jgi:host factor-I protein
VTGKIIEGPRDGNSNRGPAELRTESCKNRKVRVRRTAGLISPYYRVQRQFSAGHLSGLVTLLKMPLKSPARQRRKGPPPGETGQESLYLRFLSEKQVPVTVKLRDGEVVYGWIEYFDDRMIRLTREGKPNLFIYKNQIRTISESYRNIEARRRQRNRTGATQPAALPALDTPALSATSVPSLVPASSLEDTHYIDASAADGSHAKLDGA